MCPAQIVPPVPLLSAVTEMQPQNPMSKIASLQIDFVAHDDAPYGAGGAEDIYKWLKDRDMYVALKSANSQIFRPDPTTLVSLTLTWVKIGKQMSTSQRNL